MFYNKDGIYIAYVDDYVYMYIEESASITLNTCRPKRKNDIKISRREFERNMPEYTTMDDKDTGFIKGSHFKKTYFNNIRKTNANRHYLKQWIWNKV